MQPTGNENVPAITPDQKSFLVRLRMQAEERRFPMPEEAERKALNMLYSSLSPSLVKNPDHKGTGEPGLVLREPLLMITWDKAAGRFRWAITDRVLKTQVIGHLDPLSSGIEQIELALETGKYEVKSLKTN